MTSITVPEASSTHYRLRNRRPARRDIEVWDVYGSSWMILVTGGAGFIGSHIVDALLSAGQPVRVLDAVLQSAHRDTPELNPDAETVIGDVRDPAVVAAALEGVSAVCHQAAMVGLGVDILDMPDYVGHNDLGTAVLLAELARRGFDGRFVLASSMVVYGEGRYRCGEHGLVPARGARIEPGATCGTLVTGFGFRSIEPE